MEGYFMSTILLSFESDWFSLLESGDKKFEYRKHFPKGKTTAYFYVSKPVMAITGIAEFDEREELLTWKEKYKDKPIQVLNRIDEMLTDCRFAVPCLTFQPTNQISLNQLRKDFDDFIVPRMYYYLDDLPLLDYLKKNLTPSKGKIVHNFELITNDDIC